jgi:ferrous iron transport protein A
MHITLKQLKVGERARVTGFAKGEPGYRHRLLTMGLTPGTPLAVTRVAPLGDPMEIEVRGYSLSLRKDEAAVLNIAPLAGEGEDA